ncbi:MAG: amidase [Actinomycetia bacterium]|nr:amidase [Actinomycetes bacterium]
MSQTITELASGYLDGSITPTDAVDQCLAGIEALDPKLGAWMDVYAPEARRGAAAATEAIGSGHRIGPFHGIPFALKDIVEVEGRVTTAGCAEWAEAERISPTTATIGARLLAAGGILIGKTKTVEFAMGGWGTNQYLGTPHNPWDLSVARTPGGSSSGSGVAVASGMVPCAIGTDTGGSVRLPAALCGIVGLKTTEGLLPTDGIVPLSHTLDTPGPMARTVADTALMFDTLGGRNAASVDADWRSGVGLYSQLHRGVDGLHLACLGSQEREWVDDEILAIYDSALAQLEELGATVSPFDPPKPFEDMKEATFVIVVAEGYHYHRALIDDPAARIDEHVRARIAPGASITAADYVAATLQRRTDQEAFLAAFAPFDAFVMPTTPMVAQPLYGLDEEATPAHFTRAGNYLRMCGTSLPSGLNGGRLPTSIQFACRGGDEALSLRLAAAYESARGPLPHPPAFVEGPN